jgi:hypothetical protein
MPKRLNKTQRNALLDLISATNDQTLHTMRAMQIWLTDEELPEWFLDWPIWSAGENMPGYMPDSPYGLFLTERAARGYCRELERTGAKAAGYVTDRMPTTLREILS